MTPRRPVRLGVQVSAMLALAVLLAGCDTQTVADWPPEPAQTETYAPTPAAQPALTLDRLLAADVPALCGHESGTLIDGVLPGVERATGIVELKAHAAMTDGTGRDPLTLVALNPAPHVGELAAVAAFSCDQGGVEWPDQLVGYDAELNILGAVDPAAETGGQRDLVWNLAWDNTNTAATFDWSSQYPGEANCCGTMRLAGVLDYVEVSGWDGIHESEMESTARELRLRMPELIEVSVFAGKFFTAIQDEDWPLVEILSATPEIFTEIRDHETPQRLLTKEWVPESRAICLPVDHELHSDYGRSFFVEHDAQYYCSPQAEYSNGELVWQPGVYVGAGSEPGPWEVKWMTLYLDAG
ncbi:hypothetical protein [Pseudoclavibacter helvolus]|uniref:hypothetical protein n=1 Tax=Pseudoclavibacter helvolus TaxID=255205 RepID=UPI003C72A6AE